MVGTFFAVVDGVDLLLRDRAGRAVENDLTGADADDAVAVFQREVNMVDVQIWRSCIPC